jgi:hypothetical protein
VVPDRAVTRFLVPRVAHCDGGAPAAPVLSKVADVRDVTLADLGGRVLPPAGPPNPAAKFSSAI